MTNRTFSPRQQAKQTHCQEVVQQLGGGDYRVNGKYLNNDTFLFFTHLMCHQTFSATLGQFKAGKRCPHCEEK